MTKTLYWIPFLLLISCSSPKFEIENISIKKGIQLKNPSFEDLPEASTTPSDWFNCGFQNESPPDIQPNSTFNVTEKAYKGKTYLGLVVRDIGTYEGVGQKLKKPLLKDSCYSISLMLAKSATYNSLSQKTKQNTLYSNPAMLRVWAGNKPCEKSELLAITEAVKNHNWKKYEFILSPKQTLTYIKLEAFYADTKYYNGNLLIDDISEIVPCPCTQITGQ